jgi:hypothetical protein
VIYSLELLKYGFRAPEAPSCQYGFFKFTHILAFFLRTRRI